LNFFDFIRSMKLSIDEGRKLALDGLQKLGYNAQDSVLIADHLIDSELRGYGVAGLARILSIADRQNGRTLATETTITREAPATAQIDGNDTLGYLVAYQATKLAIEKAKKVGVAVVGANNTWYTGMLSYYAEMAAAEDLVAVISSNCTAWVAPEGGYKPMFGTNPFCIGFPTSSTPVIYDIGTSKIIHADIMLAKRLGKELPPDSAFDSQGRYTINPQEALEGAMAVWGGPRGSGLAIAVQLLGVVAGSPALPPNLEDFGFLVMLVNPAMFRPLEEYKREVDEYVAKMKDSPPLPGNSPLRMPFQRSNTTREKAKVAGEFEVEEMVVEKLKALIEA
jgi:delta1-piperideine-2-carboxylate reductase